MDYNKVVIILLFIILGCLLIPFMIFIGRVFAESLFGDILERERKARRKDKDD